MYDSPEPLHPFAYEPLPSTYSTRVIRLLKGSFSRTIEGKLAIRRVRCELLVGDVQASGKAYRYGAVSYVWGSKSGNRVIELNGCAFAVSPAVEDILLRLREEEDDVFLWIDAICINQSNEAEKSEQVAHMRAIYSSAFTVLVSLGPHYIGRLATGDAPGPESEKVDQEAVQKALDLLKAPPRLSTMLGLQLSAADQDNLLKLLSHPWFERVWIIQEAACGGVLEIICGQKTYNRVIFNNLQSRIAPRVRGTPLGEKLNHLQPLLHYASKNVSGEERPELLTLLQRFRDWKATDPRDNVYALVGISRDIAGPEHEYVRPDYTLPIEIVYRRVVFHMIKRYGNLSVLARALQTPAIEPTRDARYFHPRLRGRSFPTWCPDWSVPYRLQEPPAVPGLEGSLWPSPTQPPTAVFARVESSGTLRVNGASFASVLSASTLQVVLMNNLNHTVPDAQRLSTEISQYLERVDEFIGKHLGRSIQREDRLCFLEMCTAIVILRPCNEEYEIVFMDHSYVPVVPVNKKPKGKSSIAKGPPPLKMTN